MVMVIEHYNGNEVFRIFSSIFILCLAMHILNCLSFFSIQLMLTKKGTLGI